ncbi:MAG: DinB family protein [Bacteroidetes bacterium]|nr:DinB family protein [Bacteroidota bacterium]MBU1116546.1 DinB family protein [Bacteroidota bacterium]MBU1796834.1 DinB family protein [Bacteroidota bacterium]
MKEGLIEQLKTQEKFFLNTVSVLTEKDSSFKPKEEMYTVAQQVAHAADTVNWFLEGAFGSAGFVMNFEKYDEKMKSFKSFDESIKYFKDEFAKGISRLEAIDDSELYAPIEGEIMTGAPKLAVIGAIADHTAHHRGSLAVYARLLGKAPKMPYGEM